jgi:ubiquinone/menaquinone biosynthesis C-methylase UbiE
VNTAIARSFVFGDNDRIAPLQEQWQDHVRRQFRRGPDPRQAALDVIIDRRPRTVLEVGAGSGQFAAELADRLDVSVLVTDPSTLLIEQADMRHVPGIVAEATALPLASASFDCVIVHRPHWAHVVVGPALSELTRVLGDTGMLVLSVGSPRADGHELDELLGCTLPRRAVGLTTDTAHAALASHFSSIEQTRLDHAMVFSSGSDLAMYLAASPARRSLADRVRHLAGPYRLTYDVSLLVATMPRRPEGVGS